MTNNTFIKSPTSKLDYEFDWSQWLKPGDSIISYTLSGPEGSLSIFEHSLIGDVVRVVLIGGEENTTYKLRCTILTNTELLDTRTIAITCKSR